ncbi:MAG: diguanylate cyclase [Burkholderiales bacterium]|jgi:diguanylate cyclase (GGDEF)-like protein
MTLVFDVRTLLFVGSLSSFACTVMLWSSRGLHLPSKTGLRWAAGSQLLFGLAMGAVALRGAIPDLLSFQIANTLGSGAAALTYEGVRRLTGARPLPWLAVGTNLALLAVNLRLGSDASQVVPRLQLNSAVHAVFAAASVPLLLGRLRGGNDATGPLRWATGFMVVFTFGHLLRFGVIAIAGAQMSVDGMVEGPLQMLMPTVFALGPMVYAMILLGLVNGRLAADMWRLATIDVLTGLRTRRGFVDEARRLLGDGGRPVLLMLDLDRFKQVNDRHGHVSGDRVLVQFARLLREHAPASSVIGRHGGEEFCLLLPQASPDEGHAHAQRLCDAVRSASFGLSMPVTVSIGVASAADGATLEALLLAADRRLYSAKAGGRDRVVAADDPLAPDTERMPDAPHESPAASPSAARSAQTLRAG